MIYILKPCTSISLWLINYIWTFPHSYRSPEKEVFDLERAYQEGTCCVLLCGVHACVSQAGFFGIPAPFQFGGSGGFFWRVKKKMSLLWRSHKKVIWASSPLGKASPVPIMKTASFVPWLPCLFNWFLLTLGMPVDTQAGNHMAMFRTHYREVLMHSRAFCASPSRWQRPSSPAMQKLPFQDQKHALNNSAMPDPCGHKINYSPFVFAMCKCTHASARTQMRGCHLEQVFCC